MSDSFGLFGAIPPLKPTDRLFFALFSIDEAIPKIVKASQQPRDENGSDKLSH
jgi:hypothetical protein